jgi:ABC-type lipoprotein release transport system permease subunit
VGAVWFVVRAEWRARWSSLALITLMAALSGAAVLGAFAASRRADTAFDRLLEQSRTPNVYVELQQPPDPGVLSRVAGMAGVDMAAHTCLLAVAPDAAGFRPGLNTIGGVIVAMAGEHRWQHQMVAGRAADPGRADELELNGVMQRQLKARIGDQFMLTSLTPAQAAVALGAHRDPGRPAGPRQQVRVVGIFKDVEDVSDAPEPFFFVTPAYFQRYADRIGALNQVQVRVEASQVGRLTAAVHDLFGPDAAVKEVFEDHTTRIRPAIGVQVLALRLLALTAAVAGLIATGQALARMGAARAEADGIRRVLGMCQRQRVAVAVGYALPAALAAAALAVVGAWLIGPAAITGVARDAEPNPGRWFDAVTLAVGAAGVLVALLLQAAAVAVWPLMTGGARPAVRQGPSPVLRSQLLTVLGPPRAFGVRMALESGATDHAIVPTRFTLLAAVAGIAGIVAAVTFGASVMHLLATPRLSGSWFQASLTPGEGFPTPDHGPLAEQAAAGLARDADVAAVAISRLGTVTLTTSGHSMKVPGHGIAVRHGAMQPLVRAGRLPSGPEEIALGGAILRQLQLEIGDEVRAEGSAGSQRLQVVGAYVHPGGDDVDRDALLTEAAFHGLFRVEESDEVLVRLAPGIDVTAALDRLHGSYFGLFPPKTPSSVDNLDELGALPWALAGLLAALALLAAAHALMAAVRSWRRDLAVLQALGLLRCDVRVAVRWQALTLASVGLFAGVPLGIFAARVAWTHLADGLGVVNELAIPKPTLAAMLLAVLAVTLLISIPPGVMAARARPGHVLHRE